MIDNGDATSQTITEDVNIFLEYLEKEVINTDKKWYVGSAFIGKSKTNNSEERYNKYVFYFSKI